MDKMSRKQWKRLEVLERLSQGEWTMVEGANLVGLSVRQMRRLLRSYEANGHQSVVHGNAGCSPPNKLADEIVSEVLRLRTKKYQGFNDTHFTEHLVEDEKVQVSRASVQRILRKKQIASPRKRRRRKHRRRRDRMAQAGLMAQWDGSQHDWLEGRGFKLCLMGAVDDATGKLLKGAHFVEHECSAGYLRALYGMVRGHGVPWKIYMDKHSSLRRNDDHWTLEEELAGKQTPTQVGHALEELDIEVIFADSPEAKGRIERAWGTLQDRLVSELRLAKAKTLAEANAVLEAYRPVYNKRFGKPPASRRPAWRKLPKDLDLARTCSLRKTTTVRNDNTVFFEGRVIDLPPGPNHTSWARKTVVVSHQLDGRIRVYLGDKVLASVRDEPPRRSPSRRRRGTKKKTALPPIKKNLTFKQIVAKHKTSAKTKVA